MGVVRWMNVGCALPKTYESFVWMFMKVEPFGVQQTYNLFHTILVTRDRTISSIMCFMMCGV